mgnify:FL=1
MNIVNTFLVGAKIRWAHFVDEFKKDETGVSSIVATVLLILIVVLLASLFWTNIKTWFDGMWNKIKGADTIPDRAS